MLSKLGPYRLSPAEEQSCHARHSFGFHQAQVSISMALAPWAMAASTPPSVSTRCAMA